MLQHAVLAGCQAGRTRSRRAAAPRRILVTLHLALLAALTFAFLPRVPGIAPHQAAAMPTSSNFTVTIITTGAGSVSPGSGTYFSPVAFMATPAAGQIFLGWKANGRFVGF